MSQSISSFISQQFHTLSQQNSRLNQSLISITLNHEFLLQQNKQLSEQLKKNDYLLIESNLREKNLQHTVENVQKQYQKLQNQYKQLFDWMKAEKKLEMRDLYKKQSQLAMDLTFIQRQSYRESKKYKNQQLTNYQKRIITLVKQNQTLKSQILQMTSEYNEKMYQLKSSSLQNELKLKNLKNIQSKTNYSLQNSTREQGLSSTNLSCLQIQIKLENMSQKLQFYVKQNTQIKERNLCLCRQMQRLQEQIKNKIESQAKVPQNSTCKIVSQQNCSIQYITQIFQENICLRKQIQQISSNYTLLSETYPQLIQDSALIVQLQQNINKLNQVKQLQQQLSQSSLKYSSLEKSVDHLQEKYLSQIKSKEELQYKLSIIIKRFNQMFIKMNPYFDIYKYEALNFDQKLYPFFDQHKDYKQLKQYENKLLSAKRQQKQLEIKYQRGQRQLRMQLEQNQKEIKKINHSKSQFQDKLEQMASVNLILKKQIKSYELVVKNNSDAIQNNSDVIKYNSDVSNYKQLQIQITVPLLQRMIQKLHVQRQSLLQTVNQKDNKIIQLSQQLHQAILNQSIQTISIQNSSLNGCGRNYLDKVDFNQLLRQNLLMEEKYDSTVEQFRQQIKKKHVELNQQHDLYLLQVKKYQAEYQQKIKTFKGMVDRWMASSQQLKNRIKTQQQKRNSQKDRNSMDIEQPKERGHVQQGQQGQLIYINRNLQQANPIGHPSYLNVQIIPALNQQSGNKQIGQSTVQNLTLTLKKYEHQMNQVLIMCAKLSEDYTELRNKLRNQEDLQGHNNTLEQKCRTLQFRVSEVDSHLQEKNKSLSMIESLYNAKSTHCKQLQSEIERRTQSVQGDLDEEKRKNQLLSKELVGIKQKIYQVSPKQGQHEGSSISKGQFQAIFVMQANKNKDLAHLTEKNRSLQVRLQLLMEDLNNIKKKSFQKRSQQISPLQRAQMKQLSSLLQETNLIQLVRRANHIIQKEEMRLKQRQRQNIQQVSNQQAKQDQIGSQ